MVSLADSSPEWEPPVGCWPEADPEPLPPVDAVETEGMMLPCSGTLDDWDGTLLPSEVGNGTTVVSVVWEVTVVTTPFGWELGLSILSCSGTPWDWTGV